MRSCETKARSEIGAHAGRARVGPVRTPLAAWGLAALLIFGPPTIGACLAATDAPSDPAKSVALLNVQFLNDHQDLEPTTAAERARIALIASVFKAKLETSGRYHFVSIPADAASKIAAGPEVGACGGCEFGYGKELGADTVAWIVIQKVSDLILNINVYMADVGSGKLAFVHSVDIRGDNDEFVDAGNHLSGEELLAAGSMTAPAQRAYRLHSEANAHRRESRITPANVSRLDWRVELVGLARVRKVVKFAHGKNNSTRSEFRKAIVPCPAAADCVRRKTRRILSPASIQ